MMAKKRLRVKIATDCPGVADPASWGLWLCGLAVLLVIGLQRPAAGARPTEPVPQPLRYMIVVTGGELLRGAYPDGHTYFITRTLHPLGLRCVGSMCVDDKQTDLNAGLRYAMGRAPLVVVTGGLGPTDNDITRETLSDLTGIALREHPDVLRELARRFGVSPAQLRPNLRRQTQVPVAGTYFKNPNGTAVGLVFELADSVIVALPGPPRELQAMVQDGLVPYLSRRFGTRRPGCSLTLRFVGLGQSQIDQTLADHVPLPPEVAVSSRFEGSRVDFSFTLPDDTARDREQLDELKRKIMEHLGEYVYADDEKSLEGRVVELLQKRGATLALAEAGSGGSLAAALSSEDGATQILAGAYVAANMERLRRLLGVRDDRWAGAARRSQKIEQLAVAASDATASQWAVAVSEAWRDKSGADYMEVAFKLPDGRLESQQVRLRGSGETARSRLGTQLLDRLRRRLK